MTHRQQPNEHPSVFQHEQWQDLDPPASWSDLLEWLADRGSMAWPKQSSC